MTQYTLGRNAPGYCERCQFKWPLAKLQPQPVAGKPTDLLVCPDCLDEDHPQLMLGRLRFSDPQALRRPAPPNEIHLSSPIITPPGGGTPPGGTTPPPGGTTPVDPVEDAFALDVNFRLDESPLR